MFCVKRDGKKEKWQKFPSESLVRKTFPTVGGRSTATVPARDPSLRHGWHWLWAQVRQLKHLLQTHCFSIRREKFFFFYFLLFLMLWWLLTQKQSRWLINKRKLTGEKHQTSVFLSVKWREYLWRYPHMHISQRGEAHLELTQLSHPHKHKKYI